MRSILSDFKERVKTSDEKGIISDQVGWLTMLYQIGQRGTKAEREKTERALGGMNDSALS